MTKVQTTSRILPLLALAAALTASGALAQQSQPKAGKQPGSGQSGMMSGNMGQMMAMHNQMMADMKAMDASLDQKVALMNAAKGNAKVDATAAVINEMVTQRKQMMANMSGMEDQMMKGMKDMDGKSAGAHKDHHEEQK